MGEANTNSGSGKGLDLAPKIYTGLAIGTEIVELLTEAAIAGPAQQ